LGIMVDLKTIAPLMTIVLVGLLLYVRRKQHRNVGYLLCFSVFYVYLLYVFKYTMLPLLLFSTEYTLIMKAQGSTWTQGLNLIPFRELTVPYLLSVQGIGNVLLTVPFGFGLPFLVRTDLKSIAWKGLFLSILIELMQLIINIGYGYRVRTVDVNDVLLNFVGVVIGFALFYMLSGLYSKIVTPKTVMRGAWSHIHAVLTRQSSAAIPERDEVGDITFRSRDTPWQ
jgi:glycopeptide antibiotics resistance protein